MNVKRSMPGFGEAAVPALFVILFLIAGTQLQAGGIDSFSLDWKTDTAAGLLSLGVFVWGQAAEAPSSGQVDFGWFDEGLSFPYSLNLDTLGDIATLAGLYPCPSFSIGSMSRTVRPWRLCTLRAPCLLSA
jgi:hypothetical protein